MPEILVYSPDPVEASRYRDLLTAKLPDLAIESASTPDEASGPIASARILFGWKFPAGLIGKGKALEWVHKVSAGVEDVTGQRDLPPGLRLSRTGGEVIAPRMVEYVLGAIFATTQKFPRAYHQMTKGRWEPYDVEKAVGKTVGIAGLGDIGMAIAHGIDRNGMAVTGWRRSPGPPPTPLRRIFAGGAELVDFLAQCDFIVAVLPATAQTDGLFAGEAFAAMKPGATFINVGRGNCVDEEALASAVANGTIAGAFLDVTRREPLPANSPLWRTEGITITPHVSGPIIPEDVMAAFFENLDRFRDDKPLLKEVDLARGY